MDLVKITILATWLVLTSISCIQSDVSRINEVGPGWSKTLVNATNFRKNALVSDKKYQYISYYNGDGQVVLGKRRHGHKNWELHTTQYSSKVLDAHNVISIMVDGDGYLHVSWNHHDDPLNYARTLKPGGLELGSKEPMVGTLEDETVTYPEFYALPDGGMYFVYRYGASGSGYMVLNRYHMSEKRWERVHDNLVDGEGKRNFYWQMAVDNHGGIHLSYVWRNTWDVSTNHNICYARSNDGGQSWITSYGRSLHVPITYSSSEIVLAIPPNSNLINQTSITTDANAHPAIASYWTAQGDSVTQFFVVYHDGNQWQHSQASNRTVPFTLSDGGTRRTPISRPQILAQTTNNGTQYFLVYRDAEEGNCVVMASANTQTNMVWTKLVMDDLEVGQWEPSYDTELWRRKGEFNLFVQKVVQSEGSENSVNNGPQTVKVLHLSNKELNRLFHK